MNRQPFHAVLLSLVALSAMAAPRLASSQPTADGVTALLRRFEQSVQNADTAAHQALLADSADRARSAEFASTEIVPGATRVVIQERDRQPLPGTLPDNGYRVMVDAFAEYGGRARVATWVLDVKRVGAAGAGAEEWAIAGEERVSSVENLYRLVLTATKQFTAHDLRISVEDLDLTLPDGSVFVVEIDQGVTGMVLLGNGSLRFRPTPETEQGQVKIFCGSETLEARFDGLFLRVNPSDVTDLVDPFQLQPRPVDARELRRAQDIFRAESSKSFVLDLGDLSRDAWSLLPGPGDFLAEIHTRRFDTLTYARSGSEAEDISLFDRRRHRNIAIYTSKQRAEARGRFYNEDELVDYDILDYDLDVVVSPERHFLEGRARVRLRARAYVLGTLTMKLADSLTVRSIVSTEYGRLFGIRVKNQNSLVINLPATIPRDKELTLTVTYAGRLEPQTPDRETLAPLAQPPRAVQEDAPLLMAAEANWLYSSRSFWYPQAPVSDYATATIRISVPASLECVASGELQSGFPLLAAAKDSAPGRKVYLFVASQPLRYLAFIVSRFVRAETLTIAFPPSADAARHAASSNYSLNLSVEANPRQTSRGRDYADRAADIATFYQSLLGDSPYPSFTVAIVENDLPGGHSPGYFAALNQPLPSSGLTWRNDPAAFTGFPDFFIAHELAHQWWGQAVGWRNYHEQWISEGFAQYFAALYARHQRGDETFAAFMRQCRRWGMDQSPQGPIYLGYRLGHIRGESRVFRALVYNKSAAVLHMLRRLVGDEPFFRGVRRFYDASRFRKAGTEDFRAAMEGETGWSLARFFDRWIYGSKLPQLKVSHRVEGGELVVHVEQVGELFDVPITLSLQYADRKVIDVPVAVTERTTDVRVPVGGTLRGVEVSKDDGTLAEIVRN
jgi:hypothetical protein